MAHSLIVLTSLRRCRDSPDPALVIFVFGFELRDLTRSTSPITGLRLGEKFDWVRGFLGILS